MFTSHRPFLGALVFLTWLTFIIYTATCILPTSVSIVFNQNEGLIDEGKGTKKSENVLRIDQGMSHEELVTEMIEMRKELKIQNERLAFQEKRINNQDRKILLLESLHSVNNEIDEEKTLATNPFYTNLILNTKKKTNYVIEREKREKPSSNSSLNSSSSIRSKFIKTPPRLCTSLFDPERPDVAILIRGNFTEEPSSCYDLRLIGHYLNGFYLVKNNGNVESIFCNFSEPTVEVSKKVNKGARLCTSLYDPEHPDAKIPNNKNFTGEPTNCFDLHLAGYYLNGYYLVKNENGNIKNVFCNFSESIKAGVSRNQKLSTANQTIVTTDVKPGPLPSGGGVHFFVQRDRPTKPNKEGTISFQIEKLNIGRAIDISTGIFTVPKNGVYHFAFSGLLKLNTGKIHVLLRRNKNETIAAAHGDVGAHTTISPMISFTATVQLKKNEFIDLYKLNYSGILDDSPNFSCTSYTGSLLME